MIKQTSTEPSLASWEASFIEIKLTSHEDWFNYYTKYGMKSSWLSEASNFLTQGAYMYLKWFPSSTEIMFFFFQETRLNYRRNICAAARELDCKQELEKDRQQELW